MLPFLQLDWMQVAQQVMQANPRVFIHDRKSYRLMAVTPSNRRPGWRYTEPDGEGSYANCLLTTLGKGAATSVEIAAGAACQVWQDLANDPEELEWVAGLPFQLRRRSTRKSHRSATDLRGPVQAESLQEGMDAKDQAGRKRRRNPNPSPSSCVWTKQTEAGAGDQQTRLKPRGANTRVRRVETHLDASI